MNLYDYLLGDASWLGNDPFVGADNPFLGGDDDLMGEDDLMGGGGRRSYGKVPQPPVQEQLFPFARTSVAASASATISGRPQRPFRTERLVIDSTIASDFTFSSLLIGVDNMFVASADISCQCFAEVAVGMRLRGFIATPGIDITISVTNQSAGALNFSGGIVGSTLVGAR